MPENQTPPTSDEKKEPKKPGPNPKDKAPESSVPPVAPEPAKVEEKKEIAPPPPPVEEPKAPEIKEEKAAPTAIVAPPKLLPEMDPTKSHQERIVAYLSSRKGTVRLNDFLKSLYGIPQPGHPVPYTSQPVMKKLKHDLKALQEKGSVKFANDSFERLGKAHFPDQNSGKTHYWDITNTPIEVVIP